MDDKPFDIPVSVQFGPGDVRVVASTMANVSKNAYTTLIQAVFERTPCSGWIPEGRNM